MVSTVSAPHVRHCCFLDDHVPWSSRADVSAVDHRQFIINGTAKVGHKGGIDHSRPSLTAKSCVSLMSVILWPLTV